MEQRIFEYQLEKNPGSYKPSGKLHVELNKFFQLLKLNILN